MKQTTFCAILLLATGCTSPKKAHTADPLRVGTIVVTPSSDIDAALYVGTIEEETSAALSFPVAGTLARTYADEGQRVQQGQLLAELDPTSARQTFDAAQAALDQAKDACARLKQLYDAESLPEIKWVEAQTRLRQAESAYGIARKNLDDCKLYAPFTGVIGKRQAAAGETVLPGVIVDGAHNEDAADRDGESPLPGTRAGDRTPGHGQPAADNRRGTRRPGIPGREDRKGCRGKPRHTYL